MPDQQPKRLDWETARGCREAWALRRPGLVISSPVSHRLSRQRRGSVQEAPCRKQFLPVAQARPLALGPHRREEGGHRACCLWGSEAGASPAPIPVLHAALCQLQESVGSGGAGAPWHVSDQPSHQSTLDNGCQPRPPLPGAANPRPAGRGAELWVLVAVALGWLQGPSRASPLDGRGSSWVVC